MKKQFPSTERLKSRLNRLKLLINELHCPNCGPQIIIGSLERTESRNCGYCCVCLVKEKAKKI